MPAYDVATISIRRQLTEDDDDVVWVETSEGLSLIEALGMLRMAEDSVIRDFMGETPDEDEDDDADA